VANCIVLCSGGINSTVAATHAARERDVHLLHVDFGQAAATVQRGAVREIAHALECGVTDIDLPHLTAIAKLHRNMDPQTGERQESSHTNTPKLTLSSVPMLMAELLGIGIQAAIRLGASAVIVGSSEAASEAESESVPGRGAAHLRQDYYYLFSRLVEMSISTKNPVRLETPLIDFSRDEIIKIGSRFNTPFDLTYACKSDLGTHCGTCADCLARNRAFDAAKMHDPAVANTHA
jgi:7-cyano-7-deazaguanine synthase